MGALLINFHVNCESKVFQTGLLTEITLQLYILITADKVGYPNNHWNFLPIIIFIPLNYMDASLIWTTNYFEKVKVQVIFYQVEFCKIRNSQKYKRKWSWNRFQVFGDSFVEIKWPFRRTFDDYFFTGCKTWQKPYVIEIKSETPHLG